MDQNERTLHSQQHKDRVDLTIQQAKSWEKFQQRKAEYAQKYGAGHADILLKSEREALEAGFNQELGDLAQRHDEQWLNYHDNQSPEKPNDIPSILEATPPKDQVDQNAHEKQSIQSMGDSSRKSLFTNPLKQTDKERILGNQPNDVDQSQDYMKAMLSAQKAKLVKEKEGETDQKSSSMSARFSQSLSYTRAAEQPNRSAERSKEIDRD